ncbi:MAG: hypothetical protein JNL96_02630 [Planctomycetaceae bacterium]|nr:hypothetical protein [Planctomycetaceae bacterium]
MPILTKDQAVELLTKAVEEELDADDLLQVHNELFPDEPVTEDDVYDDVTPSIESIVEFVNSEPAIEDLLDLWNLIYPKHRHVWYDEQSEKFHYNEESFPLQAE